MPGKGHGSRIKSRSLEDRYLNELGEGRAQRDDMLHALCRIADQLKRLADARDAPKTD